MEKREKLKSIVYNKYFLFGIFLFLLLINHYKRNLFTAGDDQFFLNGINEYGQGSLYKFLDFRYKTWSGRVILEGIMVFIIRQNIWLWRILNILVTLILCYSINKFTEIDNKKNYLITFIVFISLFSITRPVYFSSALWVVGSFNYIWPAAFGILSLLPFKYTLLKENYNKKLYLIYFISTVIACNGEQSAAVTIAFSLIVTVFVCIRDKKAYLLLILHNIFMIINGLFLFRAPGNQSRMRAETVLSFPEFGMLTTIEKVYRGLTLYINHAFYESTLLTFTMALLIFILVYNKFEDRYIRFLALLPMASTILYKLNYSDLFQIVKNKPEFEYLTFNINMYLPIGVFLGISILMVYLLYIIFDSLEIKLLAVVSYLGAIASTLSISFSPTMYTSGERIFFMTDILFVIILGVLIKEIISQEIHKNNIIRYIIGIFIASCVLNLILLMR